MLKDPTKHLNMAYFIDGQRKIVANNRANSGYPPPTDSVIEDQTTQAGLNRLREFADRQPLSTVYITVRKNNPTLLDRVEVGA